jgi:hypothetical protein
VRSRKLICPHDPALIKRFIGREIAVRVNSPAFVASAAHSVREAGNSLICVILESAVPVGKIPFEDGWDNIPLAVIAPSVGKFRNLARKLVTVKNLNARVYLPYSEENLTDIRTLVSVGVSACILLESDEIDWNVLTDLMTYALLGRVPHATLDPFAYIAEHYEPIGYNRWGSIFFEDPEFFFHLNRDGRVALSHAGVIKKNFIGGIDTVERTDCPALDKNLNSWRMLLIKNRICSTCEGFRLCMGRFASQNGKTGCSKFFVEMLEILKNYKNKDELAGTPSIWRL